MSRALNDLPQGGMIYVQMPIPENLAEQVMAIHHVLQLLITSNTPPVKDWRNGKSFDGETLTVLRQVAEQARLAACDIDRLARAG